MLERLAPLVRSGKAMADPPPYDDPMSLYEENPETREAKWLQGIWRGRGSATNDFWRLYFAVILDGEPVGMQDMVGQSFNDLGIVTTFSWLSEDVRGRGLGKEMRQAILHLAFEGFGAKEATTEGFLDNPGSNGVSRALGYQANGFEWATRRGEPAQLQRWRLTRQEWSTRRRDDIELHGIEACAHTLGIQPNKL